MKRLEVTKFSDLRVLSPPENVYERLLYFSKVLPFLLTYQLKKIKRVLSYRQRVGELKT